MKNIFLKTVSMVCLCLVAFFVEAQEDEKSSSEEIAKELSNPNTTLGTMAFQYDYLSYKGDLANAGRQNSSSLTFQPALPIPLSDGVNLFIRPNIPIYLKQPTYGVNGFEDKGFNLGNISADIAVGKTWPSKTITLAGAFGSFPTATDKALRIKEVTVGPEAMVAQLFSWGALGLMVNHAWGVSGKDKEFSTLANDPRNASITAGQYFYVVNLRNAWQITGQPTWAYNHRADKGNRLSFPIGTGLNKITKIGKLPVKIGVAYWYYLATPDAFGPQHQIRFQIAPVIPLPW